MQRNARYLIRVVDRLDHSNAIFPTIEIPTMFPTAAAAIRTSPVGMTAFLALPSQLLIRQARRPIRCIAQAPPLIFLIAFKVPLEPLNVAITLKCEDMRC